MRPSRQTVLVLASAAVAIATTAATAVGASPDSASSDRAAREAPVSVNIVSPRYGDAAGIDGKAWVVDLKITYPSATVAGFTGPQLTGPGAHAGTAPFPGTFSPGADDHLPGLVVLASTTTSSVAGFSGPGTNLANLFNITSITDQTPRRTQIQDTWIVGAPIAGIGTDATLTVAVVADRNHDGVLNDAPAVVPDVNHDGRIDARDLRALGVVGQIETVRFHINGNGS